MARERDSAGRFVGGGGSRSGGSPSGGSYRYVKIGKLTVDIGLTDAEAAIIRAKTPVRTGALQEGFVEDGQGGIINLVPYGIFVELGTGPYYKGELGPGSGQAHGFPGRYMVERSLEEMRNAVIMRILQQIDLREILELPDEIIIDMSGSDYKRHRSPHGWGGSVSG